MNAATSLLATLKQKNISLWLENEQLKFQSPPGVFSHDLKIQVKKHKQNIIHLLQQNKALPPNAINKHPTGNQSLMSYAQKRLWMIDQLEGASATYNIPGVLKFNGVFDCQKLSMFFQNMFNRHDILRSSFHNSNDGPYQEIKNDIDFKLTAEKIDAQRLTQEIEKELSHIFDLSCAPLLRVKLLKLSENEHVLIINMHHIISDGWSMGVMVNELMHHYQNPNQALKPLEIQYSDFAHWQKQWLANGAEQQQLDYWKKQLHGLKPVLDLPADRPRPANQSYKGKMLPVKLDAHIHQQLKTLCSSHGVTMYMLLLSVFQLLLGRYSGERDIAVGSPIANRRKKELEGLIGFFVNTMVMRCEFEWDWTFDELLAHTRQYTLSAYANQDIPFEKLVEEISPQRSLSHSPLFQSMFVLQNAPIKDLQLENLEIEGLVYESDVSKFDLTLSLSETNDGILGILEYSTELFDEDRMIRMWSHFQQLLTSILSHDGCLQPIKSLQILPAKERQQITEFSHGPIKDYAKRSIHQWFSEVSDKYSDAIALEHNGVSLSYQQLEDKSNQLARYLLEIGTKSGDKIGLCMDRSIDMIISILAILKTGAAYVPIDVSYPFKRIEKIIGHAKLKQIVVDEKQQLQLHHTSVNCINVSSSEYTVSSKNTHNHHNQSTDDMYVVYTSGTTGIPKGIAVSHQCITNLLTWELQQLTGPNNCLQFASIGFDLSILEILLSLLSGGCVHLIDESLKHEHQQLLNHIDSMKIDTLVLPVVVLQHFAELASTNEKNLNNVKHIITAGEQLYITDEINDLLNRNAQLSIHNQYGPAETHVVTAKSFHHTDTNHAFVAEIGQPINNIRYLILDNNKQTMPLGITGELYVTGDCISCGYWQNDVLNQAKYIILNAQGDNQQKWYKTGDLVHLNAYGDLVFDHRIDCQLKLRGFRIESSEIEEQLIKVKPVKKALINLESSTAGKEKKLIAYLVLSGIDIPTDLIKNLILQVAENCPKYMIPSKFRIIESIPLNTNGKIDWPKLRSQSSPLACQKQQSEKQLSSFRLSIQEQWCRSLNIQNLSIDDDFFMLGGHSLMAIKLSSKLKSILNIEIPVALLFSHSEFSQYCDKLEHLVQNKTKIRTINKTSRDKPIRASFAQERLLLIEKMQQQSSNYNIPTAIKLKGTLNIEKMYQAFACILKRHESLRSYFSEKNGEYYQHISQNPDLNFIHEKTTSKQLDAQINKDASLVFDLAKPQLLRVNLYQLSDKEFVLLVVMHHCISDGWSMNILVEELLHFYQGNSAEHLPKLSIQYADFSMWQRQIDKSNNHNNQLNYWINELSNHQGYLNLPLDYNRPKIQSFTGDVIEVSLDESVIKPIEALAKNQGCTLYTIMLAAFQLLMGKYSNSSDVVLGTPLTSRPDEALNNVIGYFVNTVAIRTQFEQEWDFEKYLASVKNTISSAFDNQDIPFESIVEQLQIDRNTAYSPIFQTMFSLQNEKIKQFEINGLEIRPQDIQRQVSKFDLSMVLVRGKDTLYGSIEYSTDLFKSKSILRMWQHFTELLTQIGQNSQNRLMDYNLINAIESNKLDSYGNISSHSKIPTQSIGSHFESVAQSMAHEIALTNTEVSYSYLNADSISNNMAKLLIEKKLKNKNVVVLFDSTPESIICILAILKAGLICIPLDTKDPKVRLKKLINNIQPSLIICNTHAFDSNSIELNHLISAAKSSKNMSSLPLIKPTDDAFIIFTSGSTGEAKGVIISHANVISLAKSKEFKKAYRPKSRSLIYLSPAFDARMFETWTSLLNGCECHVVNRNDIHPGNLINHIIKHKIEVAVFTTALFNQLVNQNVAIDQLKLTHLFVGGEKMSLPHANKFMDRFKNTTLYNAYGPTENTVIITLCKVDNRINQLGYVPLGQALESVSVSIVDNNHNPVAIGIWGEIMVSGQQISNGYYKDEELTHNKFKLSSATGNKHYLTGDIARFKDNGELEFLGRKDSQVKINGYRIELSEVEKTINLLPKVSNAIVLTNNSQGQDKLNAYILTNENWSINSIRSELSKLMPVHMIPSGFCFLNSLPITNNGKVDRHKLASNLYEVKYLDSNSFKSTSLEKQIISVWESVLGIDGFSPHSNFFEVGGNSIAIIKLQNLINEKLSTNIQVIDLFENYSPFLQAQFISSNKVDTSETKTSDVSKKRNSRRARLRQKQEMK